MQKGWILYAISGGLFIWSVIFLVYTGYFLDNNPEVRLSPLITGFSWIALFISFLFTLVFIIFMRNKRNKSIIRITSILTIALCFSWIVVAFMFPYNSNSTPAFSSVDFISDPYFEEINLSTLSRYCDNQSNEEYIIYIGRDDCGDCKTFEKKTTQILKKNDYGLLTYYTNQDRDGSRSEEMYALLDKYQVTSVPAVILIKNKRLIEIWDEPLKQLYEIEPYLK